MKTFGIQYPSNTKYLYEQASENLIGEKSKSIYYSTPNGTFMVNKSPSRYSSVQMDKNSARFVTQDVRFDVNDDVSMSKVTVVGHNKHRCQSVQTVMKDGTYTVERFADDVYKGGYTFKPESRQFKGFKGLLEKAIIWFSTDINGCEKVKVVPIARKLLAKIRHF